MLLERPRRSFFYIMTFLGVIYHVIDAAPPIKGRQAGPCIGMDCLHGVLMHGDEKEGDDHKHEDIYEKLQEQDQLKGQKIGPSQEEFLGVDEVESMHQGELTGPEEHKASGPNDAMTELHGVLMHGDTEHGVDHKHDHKKLTKEEDHGQDGPDPDALHGVLMHGDTEQGHDHSEEHKKLQEPKHEGKMSDAGDPEAQMHGLDADGIHSHDNVHEIDPKHKGVPSVGDLHAALHGDVHAKMETVTLGEASAADDQDFKKWKKEKDGAAKDKNGGGGWTFPFISDSILNELEIMKRRYLKRFWGDEDDEIAYKEKDLRFEKVHQHDLSEDIAAVGDTGPMPHVHDHRDKSETASGDNPRKDL